MVVGMNAEEHRQIVERCSINLEWILTYGRREPAMRCRCILIDEVAHLWVYPYCTKFLLFRFRHLTQLHSGAMGRYDGVFRSYRTAPAQAGLFFYQEQLCNGFLLLLPQTSSVGCSVNPQPCPFERETLPASPGRPLSPFHLAESYLSSSDRVLGA